MLPKFIPKDFLKRIILKSDMKIRQIISGTPISLTARGYGPDLMWIKNVKREKECYLIR